MKKTILWVMPLFCLAVLTAASCRRSDVKTVTIQVPEMNDSLSVRIVTNAALNEVVGQCDGTKHEYEVDLSKRIILYHESQRLTSTGYQRQIEDRIREIGLDAAVARVVPNPTPVSMTEKGPVQMWPGRFTAAIVVPDMMSNRDANRVVDAIAYARLGRDNPRVVADSSARTITATYESLLLAEQNIELAIAGVGYAANLVPANLGAPDSIPQGWSPVVL